MTKSVLKAIAVCIAAALTSQTVSANALAEVIATPKSVAFHSFFQSQAINAPLIAATWKPATWHDARRVFKTLSDRGAKPEDIHEHFRISGMGHETPPTAEEVDRLIAVGEAESVTFKDVELFEAADHFDIIFPTDLLHAPAASRHPRTPRKPIETIQYSVSLQRDDEGNGDFLLINGTPRFWIRFKERHIFDVTQNPVDVTQYQIRWDRPTDKVLGRIVNMIWRYMSVAMHHRGLKNGQRGQDLNIRLDYFPDHVTLSMNRAQYIISRLHKDEVRRANNADLFRKENIEGQVALIFAWGALEFDEDIFKVVKDQVRSNLFERLPSEWRQTEPSEKPTESIGFSLAIRHLPNQGDLFILNGTPKWLLEHRPLAVFNVLPMDVLRRGSPVDPVIATMVYQVWKYMRSEIPVATEAKGDTIGSNHLTVGLDYYPGRVVLNINGISSFALAREDRDFVTRLEDGAQLPREGLSAHYAQILAFAALDFDETTFEAAKANFHSHLFAKLPSEMRAEGQSGSKHPITNVLLAVAFFGIKPMALALPPLDHVSILAASLVFAAAASVWVYFRGMQFFRGLYYSATKPNAEPVDLIANQDSETTSFNAAMAAADLMQKLLQQQNKVWKKQSVDALKNSFLGRISADEAARIMGEDGAMGSGVARQAITIGQIGLRDGGGALSPAFIEYEAAIYLKYLKAIENNSSVSMEPFLMELAGDKPTRELLGAHQHNLMQLRIVRYGIPPRLAKAPEHIILSAEQNENLGTIIGEIFDEVKGLTVDGGAMQAPDLFDLIHARLTHSINWQLADVLRSIPFPQSISEFDQKLQKLFPNSPEARNLFHLAMGFGYILDPLDYRTSRDDTPKPTDISQSPKYNKGNLILAFALLGIVLSALPSFSMTPLSAPPIEAGIQWPFFVMAALAIGVLWLYSHTGKQDSDMVQMIRYLTKSEDTVSVKSLLNEINLYREEKMKVDDLSIRLNRLLEHHFIARISDSGFTPPVWSIDEKLYLTTLGKSFGSSLSGRPINIMLALVLGLPNFIVDLRKETAPPVNATMTRHFESAA